MASHTQRNTERFVGSKNSGGGVQVLDLTIGRCEEEVLVSFLMIDSPPSRPLVTCRLVVASLEVSFP